jgi:hypothetical protein
MRGSVKSPISFSIHHLPPLFPKIITFTYGGFFIKYLAYPEKHEETSLKVLESGNRVPSIIYW